MLVHSFASSGQQQANKLIVRLFRTRTAVSQALTRTYKLENHEASRSWPPLVGKSKRHPFNRFDRMQLLRHLRLLEIERMKKLQPFNVRSQRVSASYFSWNICDIWIFFRCLKFDLAISLKFGMNFLERNKPKLSFKVCCKARLIAVCFSGETLSQAFWLFVFLFNP